MFFLALLPHLISFIIFYQTKYLFFANLKLAVNFQNQQFLMRSHTKFGPDRFSRFDDYRLQTDKQRKYIEVVLWVSPVLDILRSKSRYSEVVRKFKAQLFIIKYHISAKCLIKLKCLKLENVGRKIILLKCSPPAFRPQCSKYSFYLGNETIS